MIEQDASHRFVTDTEKTTWNGKASTAVVTQSANGLMSAADKKKLDGVAAGANNTSIRHASRFGNRTGFDAPLRDRHGENDLER